MGLVTLERIATIHPGPAKSTSSKEKSWWQALTTAVSNQRKASASGPGTSTYHPNTPAETNPMNAQPSGSKFMRHWAQRTLHQAGKHPILLGEDTISILGCHVGHAAWAVRCTFPILSQLPRYFKSNSALLIPTCLWGVTFKVGVACRNREGR